MTDSSDGVGGDPELCRDTSWRQAAQRRYDPEVDGDLSTTVVFAIAAAEDVSPGDLDSPLYDAVDVAGIEQTFFGPGDDDRQGTGAVEFRYGDHLVRVRSDGWVQVYERSERS